ncbi:MAG: iron ABC transporter permease [Gemmatimonadales bacterium]|nr:iron ABC transporter permease [Gemmatimonadales bacterium]
MTASPSVSTMARRLAGPALVVAALGALALGLLLGAVPLSPGAVIRALLETDAPDALVVRRLRLPRVLLAFGVGGGLAVAGAALQALVRNPLAEPWLLGLSGGASLGAVLALVLGVGGGWGVAGTATIGALAAIALAWRIALVAGRRLDPRVLLLAGVVVGAFASAVSTAILTIADPFTFRAAAMWLFGGFAGATPEAAIRFGLIALAPLALLFAMARGLDLLALGEESAAALGADIDRLRGGVVLATAILTAAAVSVSGVIGFVGLVVPHAMRWWVGPLHRSLLPAVFVAGGAFLVVADTAARTVLAPAELPVGVVTALVGVPLFAVLLRRSVR